MLIAYELLIELTCLIAWQIHRRSGRRDSKVRIEAVASRSIRPMRVDWRVSRCESPRELPIRPERFTA